MCTEPSYSQSYKGRTGKTAGRRDTLMVLLALFVLPCKKGTGTNCFSGKSRKERWLPDGEDNEGRRGESVKSTHAVPKSGPD